MSFEVSPEEKAKLVQYQKNVSDINLMDIEAPFTDSFLDDLEAQPSEATQLSRRVNELRVMQNITAQPSEAFAAKFDTNQELLDDISLEDLHVDTSLNDTVVRPPPLRAQRAEDFAAKFELNDEFLDDFQLDDDNNVSVSTPRRFRVTSEPQAPPRRHNVAPATPLRMRNVGGRRVLEFEE